MSESTDLRRDINGDPEFFITDPLWPAPLDNWYAVAGSECGIIAYCATEELADQLTDALNYSRITFNPSSDSHAPIQ